MILAAAHNHAMPCARSKRIFQGLHISTEAFLHFCSFPAFSFLASAFDLWCNLDKVCFMLLEQFSDIGLVMEYVRYTVASTFLS